MRFILNLFFKPQEDEIYTRLMNEKIVTKQFFLLSLIFFLIIFTFIFSGFFWFKMSTPYDPRVFMVYPDNKEELINTLPNPIQSIENVRRWTNDAASNIYNFDPIKIDEQIEKAQFYFTPFAYSQFVTSIEVAGIKDKVINNKIIINTIPLSTPVPVNGGVYGGKVRFWRLRVPVLLVYQSSASVISEEKFLEVDVIRIPTHQNPSGLAISRFNFYK